jgi:hypothetical protein
VYQLQKYYKAIYQKLKAKEFEVLGSFFSESIKKGIETGLFRPEVDINFVTRIFFNGIRGIQDIELEESKVLSETPLDFQRRFSLKIVSSGKIDIST